MELPVTLDRGPQCDITIEDPLLSRKHTHILLVSNITVQAPAAAQSIRSQRLVTCFRAATMLIIFAGCGTEPKSQPATIPTTASEAERSLPIAALVHSELEIDIPLVNTNPGYLGAQACGECHESRLHEFQQTRHHFASYAPDDRLTSPGFDDVKVTIPTHLPNAEFLMQRQGSSYAQNLLTRNGVGASTSKVAFAYGLGGSADEVFFAWHGNELRELPLGWLHPFDQWGAQQFTSPDHPTDFSRVTTTRCVECHTTWFEHRLGTDNVYRPDSFLGGISCERCHGPGREHVEHHRQHPKETASVGIVHPGHLTRDRRMDLCGQCHSNSIFRRTELFSFRPGDDLQQHFRQHLTPNFEDDNVANQVKYLSQSKCFQASDTMSCVTCHSPHHTQTAAEQGRASCRNCHESSDCGEQERLPVELRDNCATCHMPKYARLAVRFHTKNDRYVFPVRPTQHRIGVYPEARDEALLQWLESNPGQALEDGQPTTAQRRSELTAHWLKKADEFRESDRFVAAIGAAREAVRWDETDEATTKLQALIGIQSSIDREFASLVRLQEQRKFAEAVEAGQRILALKPNHAITLGKIGTCFAAMGDIAEAESYLTKSADADPDNSYGKNMLGWLAFLDGKFDVAIQHFQDAEEIYPHTADNNYRWGLALNAANRWEDAKQKLELALSINPDDANVCLALCQANQGLKQFDDALRQAYRAARLTGFADLQSLEFLATEYRRANQLDRAAAVIQSALMTPAASDPDVEIRLKRQLQSIRLRLKPTTEAPRE